MVFPLQNIMTFNQCSIKGKAYGDPVDEHGNPMDITVVSFLNDVFLMMLLILQIIELALIIDYIIYNM